MLTILSLNAWGGRVHGPLLRYLAETNADIVCLQEVTRTVGATADWLTYRDGEIVLPQRANLFAEIAALLPGHQARFHPASRGPLLDGSETIMSEFGLASFVRGSLPIIAEAEDFVHGAFSPEGWGEHPRARNAQCLRLYSYADGFSLTVAQMHGLRDPAGKHDTPARLAQASAFAALIGRVWRKDERLIACGDFNVEPGSATFAELGRLGLADLVTGRGHSDTRTSLYRKPGRFADYMLVSDDVTVDRFDVVAEPEVSDHRPLLLAFR